MKVGMRTPSPSKSVSARTSGRITRSANKAVNPVYGKRGAGFVNDPKRAAYNSVYNRTTRSAFSKAETSRRENNIEVTGPVEYKAGTLTILSILSVAFGIASATMILGNHFLWGFLLCVVACIMMICCKTGQNKRTNALKVIAILIFVILSVILIISGIKDFTSESFALLRGCSKIIIAALLALFSLIKT